MIFASLIFKSEDNNKKESVQKLSSIPTTQNELVQKPSTQPAKQADKITDNKKKPVSIKITNYILKKMGVIIEDE